MKKLRFFGLLAAVVLLAFALVIACSNGSTDPVDPNKPGGEEEDPKYPILGGDGNLGAVGAKRIDYRVRATPVGGITNDPTTLQIDIIFDTTAQAASVVAGNIKLDPKVTGLNPNPTFTRPTTGDYTNIWSFEIPTSGPTGLLTTSGPVEIYIVQTGYYEFRKPLNLTAAPPGPGMVPYTVEAVNTNGVTTGIKVRFAAADAQDVEDSGFANSDISIDLATPDNTLATQGGNPFVENVEYREYTLTLATSPLADGNATVTITKAPVFDPVGDPTGELVTPGIDDRAKQVALTAPPPITYTTAAVGTPTEKIEVRFAAGDVARLKALGFAASNITVADDPDALSGFDATDAGNAWTVNDAGTVYTLTLGQDEGLPKAGNVIVTISKPGVDAEPHSQPVTAPAAITYTVEVNMAGTTLVATDTITLAFAAADVDRVKQLGLVVGDITLTDTGKTNVAATAGWVETDEGELYTWTVTTAPTKSGAVSITIDKPGISSAPVPVNLVAPKASWSAVANGTLGTAGGTTTVTLAFSVAQSNLQTTDFEITPQETGNAEITGISGHGTTTIVLTVGSIVPGKAKIRYKGTDTNIEPNPTAGAAATPFQIVGASDITFTAAATDGYAQSGPNEGDGEATTEVVVTFGASIEGITTAAALKAAITVTTTTAGVTATVDSGEDVVISANFRTATVKLSAVSKDDEHFKVNITGIDGIATVSTNEISMFKPDDD